MPTLGRCPTSASKDWCTPPRIVEAVREFFGGFIELDPCSNQHSVVNACMSYSLPHLDGLKEQWLARYVFVNPPYGRDAARGTSIYDWLRKCAVTHEQYGNEIIALVPVATNTLHWKHFVFPRAAAICFLADTRLKFLVDGKPSRKGAPMACALVYWGNRPHDFKEHFSESFGAVLLIGNSQPPPELRQQATL